MNVVRCVEGVSTRERIAVTGDVYNITGRLKEIDRDYFVMFNKRTQRFEVHIKGQWCTLGCELPFEELDARTILYVREHHASRMAALMAEMERAEAAQEAERARRMAEMHERAFDGLRFAEKSTRDEFPTEVMRA